MPDESVGSVVCDPPYGLEFMGKTWDKLDWTMQGSFAGGGSDRFKSSPPLPSYGGATSENRICRTCKGSERGNDRVGFKRCRCEDPKFPERKLSTNAIGLKIQDSHGLWLAQVYRVLSPGGSIKVFAATRTQHRLTSAIEAVGFMNIGVEAWVYGSGFPKSHSLDGDWEGWGTALKPAWEPVIVAKKPLPVDG
jgi:site-specific DNA-methyltransferase (adenine-specific)